MADTNELPIVILGAGLAGLTAATYLHQHGKSIRVFEASHRISGLARSEKDEEGFTYDCGPHFITNRLAAAVGLAATCRPMKRYGEVVYLNRKYYWYPWGLLFSPKFVASAIFSKITHLFAGPTRTVVDHYRRQYGQAIADKIAVPLTQAWSGYPGTQLAPAIGEKFATSMLRSLYLVAMRRVTGRTIGVGYSGTFPENTSVWHVYPEGGIGSLCEKMAERIPQYISTDSPVEAILVEEGRVVGVRIRGGETIRTHHVISTAPVHALAKMVEGTDKLDYLKNFQYRAMLFVNLKLQGKSGLPEVVTWFPEDRFTFFRVSDIGLGLPFLVPEGKAQITCDIGCRVGDELWTMSEEELTKKCIAQLDHLIPGLSDRVLGSRVVRTPLAYPIFKNEYESQRVAFRADSGIEGLTCIGRNGEFDHILMEDVYWRTRRKMQKILSSSSAAE